ncbi:hypothetical protein PAHAL_5G072500 [Panicum hallii]|uniref:Uncharacterized protein n=1 Tax=Panicum hallii TaxID=206008 RepID=A0A2T8IJ83_9POAL|nr:hypothetical protein PAHAL_5G072500 [Panicum hallii]
MFSAISPRVIRFYLIPLPSFIPLTPFPTQIEMQILSCQSPPPASSELTQIPPQSTPAPTVKEQLAARDLQKYRDAHRISPNLSHHPSFHKTLVQIFLINQLQFSSPSQNMTDQVIIDPTKRRRKEKEKRRGSRCH